MCLIIVGIGIYTTTILYANIIALSVQSSRVNHAKEMPNQIIKFNLGRVIAYVHGLSVTSVGKNDLLIGRVDSTSIGIARNGRNDAGQTLKIRLDAPKAATGKINVT